MDTNGTDRGALEVCDECGRSGAPGFHLASASRIANGKSETRYFCHNDERSCYNERRGRYFDADYPKRSELL